MVKPGKSKPAARKQAIEVREKRNPDNISVASQKHEAQNHYLRYKEFWSSKKPTLIIAECVRLQEQINQINRDRQAAMSQSSKRFARSTHVYKIKELKGHIKVLINILPPYMIADLEAALQRTK